MKRGTHNPREATRCRTARWGAHLVVPFALLLAVSTARAQAEPPGRSQAEPPGPSLAERETARALFHDGDQKFSSGDYAAAFEAFRAADELMGLPTTRLERARSAMMLGRLLEAHELLSSVPQIVAPESENTLQRMARSEAATLAQKIEPRIPSIQVVLRGAPQEALVTLRIDGKAVPRDALRLPRKVEPGRRLVQVSVSGFMPHKVVVTIIAGQHRKLVLALTPVGQGGKVVDPWGTASQARSGSAFPTLSWVGVGTAVVGLSVGISLGLAAEAAVSDLEDEANCGADRVCDEARFQDTIDQAMLAAHGSTVGFGVAGAGALLVLGGLLWSGESTADGKQAAFSALVSPGFLGLRGRF